MKGTNQRLERRYSRSRKERIAGVYPSRERLERPGFTSALQHGHASLMSGTTMEEVKSFLRTKALWIVVVLLALNAVLFAATPGLAVPRGLAQYFFGPKLVRAEIVMRDAGEVRLYRVDHGRIRAVRPAMGTLTIVERDASLVTIPIAADADVTLGGRTVVLSALRRGMVVTTVRLGDEPAETVVVAGDDRARAARGRLGRGGGRRLARRRHGARRRGRAEHRPAPAQLPPARRLPRRLGALRRGGARRARPPRACASSSWTSASRAWTASRCCRRCARAPTCRS